LQAAFDLVGKLYFLAGGSGGRRLYRLEQELRAKPLKTWTRRVKGKLENRSICDKKKEPTHHDVVIKYLTERVSESEMAVYQGYLENPDSDAGLIWRKERNRRRKRARTKRRR
jgi:hypothetical protein